MFVYRCEPCGIEIGMKYEADLTLNMQIHESSEQHLTRIAEHDGDVPS